MRLRANPKCEKPCYNRFLFLQPSLQFCPSLFLSRNIGRKGRGTLFVRMPALRDLESGGPELEYITSRQEKTKRCTKLDKNVVQRYVKTRQRRNKTATENCLLLRGLFYLYYICNLSSFNTVVIGQLQWHHILCFAAAISYRK